MNRTRHISPLCGEKFFRKISELTEITDKTIPQYLTASLALLWLWSGIQPLVFAPVASLALLAQTGVTAPWQWPLLIAASALDICLGIACLTPLRRRPALWLIQLVVVVLYSLIITWRLPEYLNHPFAPVMKNLPILAILFFLYRRTRSIP